MFVKDIRLQIALTLGVIALLSIVRFFSFHVLLTFLVSLVGTQIIELFFLYITKRKIFLSYSAIITGLLIFLIWQSDSLWTYGLAAVLAISSKYIIKFRSKHIFNPAAFGLLTTSLITSTPASWWGTSWNSLLIIILYIGVLPVLKRLRRLYIIASFLLMYFLIAFIITKSLPTIQLLLDGTIMLFALIMLPEPQTSPITGIWQKSFGLLVGAAIFIPTFIFRSLVNLPPDSFLFGLLFADLLSFIFILINIRSHPNIIPAPTKNA